MSPEPQRLRALEHANAVRLARAELKRRLAKGDVSAAEVILTCPESVRRWTISELLTAQRRWGTKRCRKFLERNGISEIKLLGSLTDRQRRMLAGQLRNVQQESLSELIVPRQEKAAHKLMPSGSGLAPANRTNQTPNPTIATPALMTTTASSIE
jgi:hypothetical protein